MGVDRRHGRLNAHLRLVQELDEVVAAIAGGLFASDEGKLKDNMFIELVAIKDNLFMAILANSQKDLHRILCRQVGQKVLNANWINYQKAVAEVGSDQNSVPGKRKASAYMVFWMESDKEDA